MHEIRILLLSNQLKGRKPERTCHIYPCLHYIFTFSVFVSLPVLALPNNFSQITVIFSPLMKTLKCPRKAAKSIHKMDNSYM